jgi:hypothetical protein
LGRTSSDPNGTGQVLDSRQNAVKLEPVFDVDTDPDISILGAIDFYVHVGYIDPLVKDNVPHVAQEKGAIVGVNIHAGQIRFARTPPFDGHQPALVLVELIEEGSAIAAMDLDRVSCVDNIADNVIPDLSLAAEGKAPAQAAGAGDRNH